MNRSFVSEQSRSDPSNARTRLSDYLELSKGPITLEDRVTWLHGLEIQYNMWVVKNGRGHVLAFFTLRDDAESYKRLKESGAESSTTAGVLVQPQKEESH